MTCQNGKVKFFNAARAFGFIQPDDGGDDVFCHITALTDRGITLAVGDKVTFEVVDDNRGRGKKAANVSARLVSRRAPCGVAQEPALFLHLRAG